MKCGKCAKEVVKLEELFQIESEITTHYFCKACIKGATDLLTMKIIKTKEEKELHQEMKKFLRYEEKN